MDGLDAVGETAGAAAVEMAVSAILERGGKVAPCTNCKAPMIGAYCGICGQPVETHRRHLGQLLHDFFKDIVSFDSRILRTVRALILEPGELPLAFREGRTQRYVPAVRLYLFTTLIFFLVLSASGIAILQLSVVASYERFVADKNHNVYLIKDGVRTPMDGFKADDKGNVYLKARGLSHGAATNIHVNGTLSQTINSQPHFFSRLGSVKSQLAANSAVLKDLDQSLKDKEMEKSTFGIWVTQHVTRMLRILATNPAAVNGPLTEWIPRTLFILLPIFALLLSAFYWRQRRDFYFVDHLVFSLNLHTFGFVLLLAAVGLAQLISTDTVLTLLVIGLGIYLLLAMKRFYRQGWGWTTAKFAAVSFIYMSFILLPAFGGIILLALLNM